MIFDTDPLPSPVLSWPTVSGLVAAILGVAGLLKLYAELQSPVSFGDRWQSVALINAELWLAAWLWSGWRAREARWSIVACFTLFAAFSLSKGLQGASSCGCFGNVTVNPWVKFGLELMILTLLLSTHKLPLSKGENWVPRPVTGLGGAVGLTVLSFVTLAVGQRALAEQHGFLVDEQSNLVILEPNQWVGREFALARHTDREQELLCGDWILVLLHHGCSVCEALLDELSSVIDSPLPIVLVELPPHVERTHGGSDQMVVAKLSGEREWFVETPSAIIVKDGTVIDVPSPVPEGSVQQIFDLVQGLGVRVAKLSSLQLGKEPALGDSHFDWEMVDRPYC